MIRLHGLDGLAALDSPAFQFPLPDYDVWERERSNLGSLGEGEDIASLQKAYESAYAEYLKLYDRSRSIRPGIPYSGEAEAVAAAYSNLESVKARLTAAQDLAQAKASAAAATPSGAASTTRKDLEGYVRQLSLLKMGGFYDFGAGSNRRNLMYKTEAGLSDTENILSSFNTKDLLPYGLAAFLLYILLKGK